MTYMSDGHVSWHWPDGHADREVVSVLNAGPYGMAVDAIARVMDDRDFVYSYVQKFEVVVPFAEGRVKITVEMKMEDYP